MNFELLDQYIEQHIEPEDPYLYKLYRATNIHTVHGRMASGHLQGVLLKLIVQMLQPKNVLEIGTFSGYSAIAMAKGLPDDGHLWTFEINDEMEDFAQEWINNSSVAEKIHLTIGDANALVPQMGIIFDLVFLDGDKKTYLETYEMALRFTRKGGFILADNTLWDGHVIDPNYDKDAQTKSIKAFNDFLHADTRVEKVILPLRDGLTLIRKK